MSVAYTNVKRVMNMPSIELSDYVYELDRWENDGGRVSYYSF